MDIRATYKLENFFKKYPLKRYPKGQILLLSGESTDYVYQLAKGKVKQYDVSYRGDEVILSIFKPPAFFPMSVAINKTYNPYIYEADSPVEIHQVPAKEALDFLSQHPDVLIDLLARAYRGTDLLLGRVVQLMTGTALSRVIYELSTEARRFGEIKADNSCTLQMSAKDIAARAGLSRETVTRQIQKLKTQGLLVISHKTILITNVTTLENKINQT